MAMLPCSKKFPGSNPGLGSFCMEFACSPVHVWVLTGSSGFLPQSENMTVRLIGLSKCTLGVCVHTLFVLCVSMLSFDGLATCPYHIPCPMTAADRHQPAVSQSSEATFGTSAHQAINVLGSLSSHSHLGHFFISKFSDVDMIFLQCFGKISIPRKNVHILSHYNHQVQCNILGFNVIDQHKEV
ncbi:hypothetical protein XENORESO_004583 [Xenotaenia resolanae]|uniref:Uncharacterized protein n=1 Tax=Xenotaenia resolanae TaxID=208358 RepID=A0ABV0WEN9_9TELE